jgi:hypothetical protein
MKPILGFWERRLLFILAPAIFAFQPAVEGHAAGLDVRMDTRLKEPVFNYPMPGITPSAQTPNLTPTITPTPAPPYLTRHKKFLAERMLPLPTPVPGAMPAVLAAATASSTPFLQISLSIPFTSNSNPAASNPRSTAAGEIDTCLGLKHGNPIGMDTLNLSLNVDSDDYLSANHALDSNNFFLNLDYDFTHGIDFNGAAGSVGIPFIYLSSRKSFTDGLSNEPLSWANDVGVGWKERNLARDGSAASSFEMDAGFYVAQRFIEAGQSSTAFNLELPFTYKPDGVLVFHLDLSGTERWYDWEKEASRQVDSLVQAQAALDYGLGSRARFELLGDYARNFSPLSANAFDQWKFGAGFKADL